MNQNISIESLVDPIFKNSPKISNYFKSHTKQTNEYIPLMIQLLLQSIQKRQAQQQRKQNKKHYNILSPSQKKQVTPKVTEMIPVSPQKIIIYGKPKVKLDNGYGCPVHKQNCFCSQDNQEYQQQFISTNNNDQKQKQNKYPISRQCQNQQEEYQNNIPLNYEEYLSPKKYMQKKQNKNKKKSSKNYQNQESVIFNTNKKNNNQKNNVNRIKSPQSNQTFSTNRIKSPKSHMKQNINHQSCYQNYTKVQSKIKDLIQRDKKNRQIQKQLQKQKNQIQQIYDRQNKLLITQKQQKQMLNNNQYDNSDNYQNNNVQNQFYTAKIKTISRNNNRKQKLQSQQIQSQSQASIVNLHGHKDQESRVQCYDCQIQRLKKRKQKAKLAIRQINKQQQRRTKLVQEIINNSELKNSKSPYSYKSSQKSHDNSILLNR